MSNSGKATLENSIKGDIDLELIGGTEQFTTTGKNLLNIPFIDGNVSETPIQCNFEKPILIHAETLPKSIQSNIRRIKVVYKDNTLKYVVDSDMQKGSLFDASPENPIVSINYRGLYITEGQYEKIQVEHGAKVTPYEPYTGGKPSPSTEYPQEIKSVGQWNEEKQKYEVDVKVTGKNLLNEEHFFDMKNWKNNQYNMRLQPNTQYVFSRRDNVGYGSNIFLSIKNTKDDRFSQIINSNSQPTNKQSVKFKTKETGLVWFLVQNNSGINLKDMLGYAQIEVGEISTEHELYKEQALTLTSDRPVTKWDKLVEQDGQIGWLYKHRIVNDLSALVKDSELIYGKDGEKYFSVSLQGALFNYDYNKIYSVAGLCPKDSKIHYVPKPMIQSVVIYVSDTDTIMTAKEHMHYKVVYETTESQFAPLSESEQTQLRNLHSYNGTTHINIDSGEVPCGIKLTYKQKK